MKTRTLTKCMADLALTDQALADIVGCSRTVITKLRHRKITASLPLALRIVEATGCSIEELSAPSKFSELLDKEAAQ
jgi:plasmid maintenance system antidote protein VapI